MLIYYTILRVRSSRRFLSMQAMIDHANRVVQSMHTSIRYDSLCKRRHTTIMTKDALLRGVTHRLLRLSSFMCAQGNVNSHVDGFADVHYVEWKSSKRV